MPSHVPATTIDKLWVLKKRLAVDAYETEATFFINMGQFMPEQDNEHRKDVELAVADMEGQQEWLKRAEEVLAARDLQGSVEDDVQERLTTATAQLTEAQAKVTEWQADDARREQEERDAEAAEQRKEAELRAQRRLDAQAAEERRRAAKKGDSAKGEMSQSTASLSKLETAASAKDVIELTTDGESTEEAVRQIGERRTAKGKRKVEEVEEQPETPTPSGRRLRRCGNTTATAEPSGLKGNTAPAGGKTAPLAEPTAPTDVSVYGEYNPSVPGDHPRSLDWGCGTDAAKNKPCPHPEVWFIGGRQCLHCQSANLYCVGTGCRACGACKARKVLCSFVNTRRRRGEASGSRSAGGTTKQTGGRMRKTRTQVAAEREAPRATCATLAASTLPVIQPGHVDWEMRGLQQTLVNLESRAGALSAALMEVSTMRNRALARFGAIILRREQHWAEQAEQADAGNSDRNEDGGEDMEQEGLEWEEK